MGGISSLKAGIVGPFLARHSSVPRLRLNGCGMGGRGLLALIPCFRDGWVQELHISHLKGMDKDSLSDSLIKFLREIKECKYYPQYGTLPLLLRLERNFLQPEEFLTDVMAEGVSFRIPRNEDMEQFRSQREKAAWERHSAPDVEVGNEEKEDQEEKKEQVEKKQNQALTLGQFLQFKVDALVDKEKEKQQEEQEKEKAMVDLPYFMDQRPTPHPPEGPPCLVSKSAPLQKVPQTPEKSAAMSGQIKARPLVLPPPPPRPTSAPAAPAAAPATPLMQISTKVHATPKKRPNSARQEPPAPKTKSVPVPEPYRATRALLGYG
ncbi:hypothetical protein AK812_SmicGene277 [Symbiodinium microadriaticum]|uniref:Uncharacterized protein n=1 Tax=Symbiodinium microadriaticum TaxID=2951 RepID=A0A1Q9F6Z0_SYMMI|nr:hypothetical protein AK812_SmicGene277 [Symbiodinium microadriaticum]